MFYKKIAFANAYNEYNGSVNYYRIRELLTLNGLRRLEVTNNQRSIIDLTGGYTPLKKRQHLLMKVIFS